MCDHRTSPHRITFELLSLEPRGCLHMHGIWQVEHASSPPCPNMGSMPGTTSSYHDVIIWGPPFCISCSGNVQCSMNVEGCVISKICNGNSIMVNTVTLENYKVNHWDIWLLSNIDGTGLLCLARPTLSSNFDQCDRIFLKLKASSRLFEYSFILAETG